MGVTMELNLKTLRLSTKLNQTDYAKIFNITQGTYSNYENGITQPDLSLLVAIANYHNVSIDYLIGRKFDDSYKYLTKPQKDIVEKLCLLDEKYLSKVEDFISGMLAMQDNQ